jgi:hypothetical protein
MKRRKRSAATLPALPSLDAHIDKPPTAQRTTGKAMPAAWRDPEDVNPNARTAREVRGWRRADPLRACLQRHGHSCGISETMVAAADCLRRAADGAAIGFTAATKEAGLPVTSAVYGPLSGPPLSARKQLRCRVVFERAMRMFTVAQSELVLACVVQNVPVAQFAKARSLNPQFSMGRLVGCLELLEQHFASDIQRHGLAA